MLNRHFTIFVFLTFVWLTCHAAPKVTTQLPQITLDQKPNQSSSKAAQISSNVKSVRTWTVFLQYYGGHLLEKDETYYQFHTGIQASFEPVDLRVSIAERTAAMSASRAIPLLSIIQLSNSMEPFYRLGLDWMLQTSDGLTSFANTKRLQAFASIGLKDVGYLDRRISAEAGMGMALTGFSYHFFMGYHF